MNFFNWFFIVYIMFLCAMKPLNFIAVGNQSDKGHSTWYYYFLIVECESFIAFISSLARDYFKVSDIVFHC